MRICIVNTAGRTIGGMQDHTRDLAAGLVGRGHSVDVFATRASHEPDNGWPGVRWQFIDAPAEYDDPGWRRGLFERFTTESEIRSFDVVHSEGSSALELVRRGVHRRIPTVVKFHGNFLGLAKAGARRAISSRRPVPVLREARAFADLSIHHFRYGNWFRFRECEAIVPSRQQFGDTCRSHLLDPARVHVVPNGVDVECFRPRPREQVRAELGLPSGLLFVCVGRLNREKGNHHALRALSVLDAGAADTYLVIVGDGEERANLEQLARQLDLAGRVLFVGAKDREGVARHLAAADVFLFPTERDEAAPLVVPQAMACGLPVIATRVGGIPEVVDRPFENGILIPAGDARALAAAMGELARSAGRRAAIGASARARVLSRYTVDVMTESTLRVYDVARQRLARS